MRVLLLITDLERGGTPLRLARLARELRAADVEVAVGCLARPGPVGAELKAGGIETFACGADGPTDIVALWRLSRYIRKWRPHLIHAHLLHANVAARLVGWAQRIPVIGSTATIEVERRWHAALERATAPLERAHIVNSRALAQHVTRIFGIPAKRVFVVPPSPGLSESREMGSARAVARAALRIPEHEFVVAWAGRFDPVKRLELVIRTAEILTAIPARFLLIGDGPLRPQVEQWLRLSNAARIVHLLGWRTDAPAVLAAADAFLFPSLTEGMPNAVLEAMACGLPVVGSDIATLREMAGPEPARALLVSGDQPAAYAAALRRLYADPALRAQIGGAAAAWVRTQCTPAAAAAAVLRVYRDVLRGRERRP